MASLQDEDMYLFQGDVGSTPNAFAGQTFDSFLDNAALEQDEDANASGFLSPTDLAVKRENGVSPRINPSFARESTSSSSSSSDSSSGPYHNRNISSATTESSHNSKSNAWGTGINGYSMPSGDNFYDDAAMSGLDQDFEAQQMASAFDFDTAASTPSGFDAAALQGPRVGPVNHAMRRTANTVNMVQQRSNSPHMTAAPAQFYLGSREASPLGSMLPGNSATSPWTKQSPSSGLEENFNHMVMNGDSPGNATFSPGMHMNFTTPASFTFGGDSNTTTPSSFVKDISSPPSTMNSSEGHPVLHIYPTSLKSRVETQIPIRMTLHPLPAGIKKLRLPTYTVSKPKFLAKPEVDRSPEILELHTSLVCTSAMQDPMRKQRALARARGEDLSQYTRSSPASTTSSLSREDDEKPLNGGEVRICAGCIQRERKRASRKKQKKPEEEEMFQKDEEKRVVVFNTNEIKEWVDANTEHIPATETTPTPPPGVVQVELPMRIACYCRHQNEKLGFMVIFTIKDYKDRVVAQAMTNSIMITDDHKTHNAPPSHSAHQIAHMSPATGYPPSSVFNGNGIEFSGVDLHANKLFKQSYSTPDLTRLQHPFNAQYAGPANAPFAIPTTISGNTSATLTPKNLSRPASPNGAAGPATKRRKPSGSGKLPTGLTMTRLDTAATQPTTAATMPNTAASSPYTAGMAFTAGPDRSLQPAPHPPSYGNSPPTPNGTESNFPASVNRSFSFENLARHPALLSAPPSRQASRPGSPIPATAHDGFGQHDPNLSQSINQHLLNQAPSRRPPPVIRKLVPAEGSVSGGTEVTLLGDGFYQGLEIMFGDTPATATTFWGEKCLHCIAPMASHPGMVPVVFKHAHPHYSGIHAAPHARHLIFTYTDDREIELLRLALRTIGKSMGTDDLNVAAQQLLQQSQMQNGGNMFSQNGSYGMPNGHQRAAHGLHEAAPEDLENDLLVMLGFAKRQPTWAPLQLVLRRPNGLTLLHLSASLNMVRLTRALILCGADANALDKNGFTPMHHAAMFGHETAIDVLRFGGADHRLRSLRNFTPADIATTLQSYQATMRPYQQSRTRLMGSRNNSSRSLSSFWDDSSMQLTETSSDDSSEDESIDRSAVRSPSRRMMRNPFVQPNTAFAVRSVPPSRRGSNQLNRLSSDSTANMPSSNTESTSALSNVWRQFVDLTQAQQLQLAEQLQHLQESAQWALPTLPNIPLPDYQNNNVMRRVSALFPQRPTSPPSARASTNESWWDSFKRSSSPAAAPPSYEELYPGQTENTDGSDTKKDTAMVAAAEAALDNHYSTQDGLPGSSTQQSSKKLVVQRPERVGLMQDRKLFLFWIPLLAIMIALMIRNTFLADLTLAIPCELSHAVQRARMPVAV